MYFIVQIKRAKAPTSDIYCTCVRSVLEYSSHVFHYVLSGYLSDAIERVEKRTLDLYYLPCVESGSLRGGRGLGAITPGSGHVATYMLFVLEASKLA